MCCGGIRKLVLATGLALGLVAVLNFTSLGSYLKVGCNRARSVVNNAVPMEFEIERLKEQVKTLTPALSRNMVTVANEQASINTGEGELNTIRQNLAKQKVSMADMVRYLDSNEKEFVYNGKVFDRKDVIQRLSLNHEAYKRASSDLKVKEQVLDARKQKLEVAKAQLSAMRDQQNQLELQISQLETQLQMVRLAQTQNTVVLDDSKLSEVRRSITQLRERIDAERIKTEMEARMFPSDRQDAAETGTPRPASELLNEVRQTIGEAPVNVEAK
jgi:chromosome segregation ATPase